MGSKWRRAKMAVGRNLCVYVPQTLEDSPPALDPFRDSLSAAALLSPLHALNSSKTSTKSSQQTCSICLTKMKQGGGHAIFTSECSHSFHFHCIASNVKHGNQICPVCRANWKEIPLQGPSLDHPQERRPISPVAWPQNDALMRMARRLPPARRELNRRHVVPLVRAPEPVIFDDDESIGLQPVSAERSSSNKSGVDNSSTRAVEIKTFPEVSAAPRSNSYEDFTILVHLKAAAVTGRYLGRNPAGFPQHSQTPRAPVDLVTVLDISGSMAGTKLALLKRAMGFVIQNLGSNDRLSVIAFSSTARRLFPLRRITDTGRQQVLQAVNSLVANGGTNIAEGLRKGVKVIEDRKEKNSITSIILLSDGQDTYTVNSVSGGDQSQPNYQLLLPSSTHNSDSTGFHVPVHTFGFGADHDASSMHTVSEISGGTFSFIETEAVIQDAFAQCIGGLLSVVVQELQVGLESVHPSLRLGSVKAGSYNTRIMGGERAGFIDVGNLYADEERDFLVSVNVPVESSCNNTTSLLKVRCAYRDPITKVMVTLESKEVGIERPEIGVEEVLSVEVDRQRNRLRAAEAMSKARDSAERGDLAGAVSALENCRRMLLETVSGKCGDRLCIALDAELKEMQERMTNRHVYEASGRAYILSGLSSHSWQRATARGDSSSLVQAYQTPSMVEMLARSQAMLLGSSSPSHSPTTQRLIQPLLSFGLQPRPR